MATIAEDIQTLLGGENDKKLEVIERRTTERLKSILGLSATTEVPAEFESIVYEVTLKRFNRIGNEGMASYSQEGLSMTFPDSDFAEYANELETFKRKGEEELYGPKRGGFRFL
ncbi:phage head-tail connector protein [Enterococcus sp. 2201sp1_2201st1_B8_2201SCRN_220225]|uniref:phage head-tail connector protein n=1 Tax=unclassified Enterococcus TaxID=2608891 RepID=UPI0034A3639B